MKLKTRYIIFVNKRVHLHGDCATLQCDSNAIFDFQIESLLSLL